MHVFCKISVEWLDLTMDILAYRAVLAPNFVEKASLILVREEIMCEIILIQLRPSNTSVEKGQISSDTMCATFRD